MTSSTSEGAGSQLQLTLRDGRVSELFGWFVDRIVEIHNEEVK